MSYAYFNDLCFSQKSRAGVLDILKLALHLCFWFGNWPFGFRISIQRCDASHDIFKGDTEISYKETP